MVQSRKPIEQLTELSFCLIKLGRKLLSKPKPIIELNVKN